MENKNKMTVYFNDNDNVTVNATKIEAGGDSFLDLRDEESNLMAIVQQACVKYIIIEREGE